jgi:hypothetical protein
MGFTAESRRGGGTRGEEGEGGQAPQKLSPVLRILHVVVDFAVQCFSAAIAAFRIWSRSIIGNSRSS